MCLSVVIVYNDQDKHELFFFLTYIIVTIKIFIFLIIKINNIFTFFCSHPNYINVEQYIKKII